jgi:serine/threonine protein kinase/tetratricopeptide (TPR) repeat protein
MMAEDADFSANTDSSHDPRVELRAAQALEAALAREKATGQLDPSPELRDLDEAPRAVLEEMLEDIHRLRRHREALGRLPAEGDLLGRYRLLKVIGRGSTSMVWCALDETIEREVAVKVLLPELGLSETQLARFKRESTIGGGVYHPAILALHDVGFDGGVHFIVTEYIEHGRTLTDLLAEEHRGLPQLSSRSAARFLQQIARGLGALHSAGIIHRDLKPANILIRSSGEPIIADLGLATLSESNSLTSSRSGAGTPFYRSPEQVRESDHLDARSDVFSLGVTMYELLVGRRPFDGGNTRAVNDQILHHDPVPPRQIRRETPRELETICLHALEKDPERRYPDAVALAEDLDHFLHHRPIEARPANALRRLTKLVRRRPVAAVFMSSMATILLICAYFLVEIGSNRRTILKSNWALVNSRIAVDRTLATAEDALKLIGPGGSIERDRSLALVEAMAASARQRGVLTPLAVARQLHAAGEFAMHFGHAHPAVDIFEECRLQAEAAEELDEDAASELVVTARLSHLRALRLTHRREESRRVALEYLAQPVGTETRYQRACFLLEALNSASGLQDSALLERLEAEYGDAVRETRTIIRALEVDDDPTAAADRLALSSSLASYLHHRHRYTEAFDLIEGTFLELRDRYGLYDYRTLIAGAQLARTLNWGLLNGLRETGWTRLKLARLLMPAAVETLGEEARLTVITRWILAEALLHSGDADAALVHYRAVYESLEPMEPPGSPVLQSLRASTAVTLNALGDCEEAEAVYREIAAQYAEALGPEHHDAIIPRRGLAEALRNQGRLEEAEEEFRWQLDALLRQQDAIGPGPAVTTAWSLIELCVVGGRPDEVRHYAELIQGLIKGARSLESEWTPISTDRLIMAAEMIKVVLTGGFTDAAPLATEILSTLPPGEIISSAESFAPLSAACILLAAGLDVPDQQWEEPTHILNWMRLRQRDHLADAAAYAAEHRGRLRQELRVQYRTTGSQAWTIAEALKRLQSADPSPALSPIEEELLGIVMPPR